MARRGGERGKECGVQLMNEEREGRTGEGEGKVYVGDGGEKEMEEEFAWEGRVEKGRE